MMSRAGQIKSHVDLTVLMNRYVASLKTTLILNVLFKGTQPEIYMRACFIAPSNTE